MSEKIYEIRDPIYGFIPYNEWEREIIDHPAFQRLRRIKQLALTDMVYPGATHTRFEHSLGVMHLATLMYEAIIEKDLKILVDHFGYNESGIKKDKQLIRLATLLHDVGHGPFSHATEEVMPINKITGKSYEHEDFTCEIIRKEFKNVIENHKENINYDFNADTVAALIEGNAEILKAKLFWRELISSQLDADRCDYLLRDSYHIGVKYGIYDYQRLVKTIALGFDKETNDIVIGVEEGGWHVAEALVIARYQMFTQVYFHKTRRAYDFHLQKAIACVQKNGKLPNLKNLKSYLKLDDHFFWEKFKKSNNENCKSIIDRNHLREVYCTPEVPKPREERQKNKVIKILQQKGIWFHEDTSEKAWYNPSKDFEVMIIKEEDGTAKPLSEISTIVDKIKNIKQTKIFVKSQDKNRAKEAIINVSNKH